MHGSTLTSMQLITDGIASPDFTTVNAAGSHVSPTAFGTHTYQLKITYTDLNGITNLVTYSTTQSINIFELSDLMPTGTISTSMVGQTAASVDYEIEKVVNNFDNVEVIFTNAATTDIVDSFNFGVQTARTVTSTNLLPNQVYNVVLSTDVNGINTTLATTSFLTLSTDMTPGMISSSLTTVNTTFNTAQLQLLVGGNPTDLANLTAGQIIVTPSNQTINLTNAELTTLKSMAPIAIDINNLIEQTEYEAVFSITGTILSPSSDYTEIFTTDNDNNLVVDNILLTATTNEITIESAAFTGG